MSEQTTFHESIINKSIKLRETLIDKLIAKGDINSEEDRGYFIKLLDGMDRTVLSTMKIKSDEKISDNQQQNARTIVADILSNMHVKKYPSGESNIRMLGDDIPSIEIVEGETFIGVQNIEYTDIVSEQ